MESSDPAAARENGLIAVSVHLETEPSIFFFREDEDGAQVFAKGINVPRLEQGEFSESLFDPRSNTVFDED